MLFPLHVKNIPKVHIYNNCDNHITKPVTFYLPLTNLKVQDAIP